MACGFGGIPKTDDIASVTISYPDITDVQMEITDSEQIETCVQLSTLLNYKLFTFANRIKDRYPITLYYNLKNGEQIKVSANNKAVFYNRKRHILKHENSFVNFVEVLFYQEYLID